jgi:hypothetical protein
VAGKRPNRVRLAGVEKGKTYGVSTSLHTRSGYGWDRTLCESPPIGSRRLPENREQLPRDGMEEKKSPWRFREQPSRRHRTREVEQGRSKGSGMNENFPVG